MLIVVLQFLLFIPLLIGAFFPVFNNFKIPLLIMLPFFIFFLLKNTEIKFKVEKYAVKIIAFAFLMAFLKILILDYFSFNVNAVDFSFFDHLVPNSFMGKFMYTAVDESIQMTNHPYFIIWLLAPLQMIFKTPLILHMAHGVVLWSAFIPLYLLLKRFSFKPIIRILLLLSFFLSPYLNRVLLFHFHPEVYYVPLFFWLYYFLLENKEKLFYLAAFLICSIKTDAPIYLFLFCLGLFYAKEIKGRKLINISLLALSFCIVNILFFMPYELTLKGAENIGPIDKVIQVAQNFYEVNLIHLSKNIWTTFNDGPWKILYPFLGIPLIIPQVGFVLWPLFLLFSVIDYAPLRGLHVYYSAPVIPFLFIGLVLFYKKNKYLCYTVPFLIIFSFLFSENRYYLKENIQFERPKYSYENFMLLKSQIDLDGGTLCTQGTLFPHFPYHQNLKLLRKDCVLDQYKYYFFNKSQRSFPYFGDAEFQEVFKRLDENNDYIKYQLDDFILYKKISG